MPLYPNGIAITGGIATGKSTVRGILTDLKYPTFGADFFGYEVVRKGTPGLAAVVAEFGPIVLTYDADAPSVVTDGRLDRSKLAAIVFSDPVRRKALEAIVHPLVQARLAEEVAKLDGKLFFYEAALLYEMGIEDEFSKVWATYCTPEVQLERLLCRDNRTEEEALKIIASQLPALDKAERADIVFSTEDSYAGLVKQVKTALRSVTDGA